MIKRAKALLIPAILLAILLTGCKTGEELVIPPSKTPVVIVTSTTFVPSQNSLADFHQWLDGVEVQR
jgi:predicted component of type VI protein secretion system